MKTNAMKSLHVCICIILISLLAGPSGAHGQSTAEKVRDDAMGHFQRSSNKVLSLAKVTPQENYSWAPMEGTMSNAVVYTHIARYNFYYLESSLGIPAPDHLNLDELESISDKSVIVPLLERSIEHVRKHADAMSEEDLTRIVRLYGRDVEAWSVLVQLVSHMNEHVGQSVSYARMNQIVPPWSR